MKLRDAFYTLNLSQLISEPTRRTTSTANLRDLVITNNPQLVTESGVLSSFSNIDHLPVFISINTNTPKVKVKTKKIWDYNNLDPDKLTRHMMGHQLERHNKRRHPHSNGKIPIYNPDSCGRSNTYKDHLHPTDEQTMDNRWTQA